jgi:hypothetical protein
MKVFIKQHDFATGQSKILGSFTVTRDEFIGYLLSKTGKTALKALLPDDLKKLKPHELLNFLLILYETQSRPVESGYERDFYVPDYAVQGKLNYSKIFLEKYLAQQLVIQKKQK